MPFRPAWLSFCLAALAALPAAAAGPRTWTLDPVHTRIVFAIDHAGFSKALGTFSGATGTLVFDPGAADWAGASVEVRVPVASLELGDAQWNAAVLARRLLDVERHPVATFVSTRVEALDGSRAIVHGRLTLRGVTRELALEVTRNAVARHPLPPFRRTAGFSASAALRRSDFGIDAWPTVIGDVVELRIEAEATAARRPGDPGAGPATPSDDDIPEEDTP